MAVFSRLALLLTLLMSACAPASEPLIGDPQRPYAPAREPQVGDILHLPTGHFVEEQEMHDVLADARIVYVGESHDNMASHRLQQRIIEHLSNQRPGQVAIGMEMFTPEQQEALDQWVAGELSEKEFLKQSDWYGTWRMDFDFYSDIMQLARQRRIPVIGLNAPRDLVRMVGGTEIADLDEETRARIPEMDFDDPYQKALTEAVHGGHEPNGNAFGGFLRVQTLWDESMADNIARYLQSPPGKNKQMVVLAGGNHIRYGFGIPRRVFRRLPTSYALVGNHELEIPEDKKDRLMDVRMPRFPMPAWDFEVYTRYEGLNSEKVMLGVRLDDEEGAVRIAGVMPDSVAGRAGLKEGDLILQIDGQPVEENFDLVYAVKQKKPGDTAQLVIERAGEQLEIEAIFETPASE
jgi:uncharacterized iron-regulated protein